MYLTKRGAAVLAIAAGSNIDYLLVRRHRSCYRSGLNCGKSDLLKLGTDPEQTVFRFSESQSARPLGLASLKYRSLALARRRQGLGCGRTQWAMLGTGPLDWRRPF